MKFRVYNKTLDPNLWLEGKKLNPEVRDALLKIAEDFYKSTELKSDIKNILFLGSSANYNWTPTSDIDLHIVIDITQEDLTEDYARKFMDGLSFKWNSEHDIEIKGHPVEVYLQDVGEPNGTPQLARPGSAIYSIFDDRWLLEPNPKNIKIDPDKVRNKFQSLQKKIKMLIQTEDVEKLKELMKSIRNYRDAGLAKGGEFSVENIVFKALRRSGDIKKLKDTIGRVYDRERSLPEGGNVLPHKKTVPLAEVVIEIKGEEEKKSEGEKEWKDFIDSLKGKSHKERVELMKQYLDKPGPKMAGAAHKDIAQSHDIMHQLTHFLYKPWSDYDIEEAFFPPKIEEVVGNRQFLLVGVVGDDLDVKSVVDYKGADYGDESKTHTEHGLTDGVRWRYNSRLNTLFWVVSKTPTEKQVDAVLDYFHRKLNITNPIQKRSLTGYNYGGHYIEELTNKNH